MLSRSRLILTLLLSSSVVFAQSSASPAQEPSTQDLVEQIRQLQQRLTEMEEHQRKTDAALAALQGAQPAAESAPQASAPSAPAPSPARPSEHMYDTSAVREATIHYPSLQIRGF